jgi:hypothetical protein
MVALLMILLFHILVLKVHFVVVFCTLYRYLIDMRNEKQHSVTLRDESSY